MGEYIDELYFHTPMPSFVSSIEIEKVPCLEARMS
jgi:hypothetical protein